MTERNFDREPAVTGDVWETDTMTLAVVRVNGVRAFPVDVCDIPKGTVGGQIRIEYEDPLWDSLKKTVVFRCGRVTMDVLDAGETVPVPPEVLEKAGVRLYVGVYGTDAEGTIAIPTLWAYLGMVRDAADPSGDTSADPALPVWAQILGVIGELDELITMDKTSLVKAINEAAGMGGGAVDETVLQEIVNRYLQENPVQLAETDPTVPSWAKAANKPAYSKAEVGLSDVDNVKQYSVSNPPPYPVTSVNGKSGAITLRAADVKARPDSWMPTAQDVGALPDTYVPPTQTAEQVGADPKGSAAAAVSGHNTSTNAHNDLRLELKAISERLNAFFDSDDSTLDELSEIVAYITSNKTLIDSITTSKVSVADIVNNLTTNVSNKPLSAAQGVVLKGLVDALSGSLANYQPKGDYALASAIPTKVSQLQNDTGYLTEHQNIPEALGYTPVKSSGWGANKNLGTDENGNITEKTDIFSKDVSAWTPVEYMDGVSWTELGYFWQANGAHTNTQYTQTYQSTTELIRIEPGCSYTLSNFRGAYFLYDSTGENGTQSAQVNDPNTPVTFDTTGNQYYIGISHAPTGTFTVDRVSLVRNTISQAEYDALPTRAESLKSLYGKTVVCFGDSLFGMYRGEDSAPAFAAAETGATVYNVGFGGCRMAVHPTSGYGAFSMWALAKAIAENSWTAQDAEAASGSAYFPEQLALLKSIDFAKVDIAVIHYGTNDFASGNGIQIDNANDPDDYNTLCGALRYSIEKLLGKYPKLRIYVSLPVYRFWTDNATTTYAETYLNRNGKTLPEFVEALRDTAAEYNLPVIDGYYGLGINKANAATFLSDGTHHNVAGRERFGRFIGVNLTGQQTTGKSGMDTAAINALISGAIGSAIGGSY